MKTSCRRRPSHASASWPWRSAAYKLLTEKYGIPAEDIIIDPLVFPCATGDVNYIGGAVETIEGIRLVKENIPYVKTVLGISNISFGLPASAREVVNSVFLYYCTKAGSRSGHRQRGKAGALRVHARDERRLAEHLLFNTPPADAEDESLRTAPEDWRAQTAEQKAAINQFHIAAIAEHFRQTGARVKQHAEDLPLDQRLANYIIEGTKDGLIADLDRKRAEGATPLEIINGPLMAGMSEVGRLFNNNELIVAEVLQSAEAMKAAVNHLEQFMEKADTAARGKVILATVKGDVHDIGKNLVEIILANNGYEVVNLGIKVPPDVLIQACREHRPDAIGLSGTAGEEHAADGDHGDRSEGGGYSGADAGGRRGAVRKLHAHQDRAGLRRSGLLRQGRHDRTEPDESPDGPGGARQPCWPATPSLEAPAAVETPARAAGAYDHAAQPQGATDMPIPPAPYLDRKVRDVPNLAEVWSYINPFMLYGRHLGYKGNFEKALAEHDEKALELFHNVEEVKQEAARFMKVKAVWQFFEAERDGNAIHLFAPGGHRADSQLPLRPPAARRRSVPERLHSGQATGRPRSSGAVRGDGGRRHPRKESRNGRRRASSSRRTPCRRWPSKPPRRPPEWLHRRIREDWGFPDPPTMTMHERFTSSYRGKRYSFGYPACPNLDDQQGIWKLLQPDDIGVQLTEGMMMEPEASVSAMVFHHPDCAYFTADESETVVA